tara:strand:- start:1047 stop:2999 length:1953 start_codon:yes stop_codon:yes gene_type:complete
MIPYISEELVKITKTILNKKMVRNKRNYWQILFLPILVSILFIKCSQSGEPAFEVRDGEFWYEGNPVPVYSGEMHYARVPKAYWRHRLKMIRAMGLNTVATYVFWNYHNTAPGIWDFETGNRDIATFLRIAQEEGLFVILRPGPYACAEWEFGGYPWWLQKNEALTIRTNNRPFLDSCRVYINKLAEQVRPFQAVNGGPIIMVQVENEFGSYVSQRKDIPEKEHRAYNHAIHQILIEAGLEGPFFTSDGSWLFDGGTLPGVLPTANGEGDVNNLKKVVNKYHNGQGPYMVAEFYPGWLDHWAEPFNRIPTNKIVKQTEKYLQNDVYFNFYMVHGGTNFGFTSGANYSNDHDIQPDLTSYDYDAPISEAGWPTDKYMAVRKLMMEYVDYNIPEIPERNQVGKIPDIHLTKSVDLFEWVEDMEPVYGDNPLTFEELDQGYGYVLYRRHFSQPVSGILTIEGLRDYALVYVNGKKIGELNRVFNQYQLDIEVPFNSRVDILVENMGRINYGAEITHNTKGIIAPVKIGNTEITGDWEMYQLPMLEEPDLRMDAEGYELGHPVIYQGTFEVEQLVDTFLDMTSWGKGIVFVNGHHLGRYWHVGPQQTLYLPGCWLEKGLNRIVVFEQQNDRPQEMIRTTEMPVLQDLHLRDIKD